MEAGADMCSYDFRMPTLFPALPNQLHDKIITFPALSTGPALLRASGISATKAGPVSM